MGQNDKDFERDHKLFDQKHADWLKAIIINIITVMIIFTVIVITTLP